MMRLARLFHDFCASLSLSDDARTVREQSLTYLSAAKLRRIERELRAVQAVPGDFVEFGVALGGSAIVIARQASGRRFHGFDVFGMIPEPSSSKDDEKSRARYHTIASGASKGINDETYYGYRSDLYSEVLQSFRRHGLIVGDQIVLHKGLFEQTVPMAFIERIAFAHLDCDWYDPAAYCLGFVADRLSPGGVIVIDDYHDYGGCRVAVDEFLAADQRYSFEDGPNPILRLTARNT